MNIEELEKEADLTISHGVRYFRRGHAEAVKKLIAEVRALRKFAKEFSTLHDNGWMPDPENSATYYYCEWWREFGDPR